MSNSALHKLTVKPELAIEFLAVFSRLEYALKVTEFRQEGNGEAKADWKRFISEVDKTFEPNKNEQLSMVFNFLLETNLNYLCVDDKQIKWLPFLIPLESNQLNCVVLKIKQIRHNLFHGGKFAYDNSSNKNRDESLLTYAIILLLAIKSVNHNVEAAYDI